MKLEKMKTIILSILVLCAIFISYNVWFPEELWSTGHNSFYNTYFSQITTSINKIFSWGVKDYRTVPLKFVDVFPPEQLLVINNSNRALFIPGDDQYSAVFSQVETVLSTLFNEENIDSVSEIKFDDYKAKHKENSVFVNFGKECDLSLMSSFFKEDVKDLPNIKSIKTMLISLNVDLENKSHIYLKDTKLSKYYQISLNKSFDALMQQANALTTSKNYSYAFELFDKLPQNNTVAFDSFTIIQIENVEKPLKTVSNPLIKSNGVIEEAAVTRILDYFNFNTNSVSRFTDKNNTVHFIENYATVKISPIGIIEYSSSQKGIDLNSDNYNNLVKSADVFLTGLYKTAANTDDVHLKLISDTFSAQGSFEIKFASSIASESCFVNTEETPYYSAKVTVDNGYIVKIKLYPLIFKNSDKKTTNLSMLDAIDKVYGQIKQGVKITDAYTVFIKGDNNNANMYWMFKFDDFTVKSVPFGS